MSTQEKEGLSAPKLQLKLLVDQQSNRVLFAEAGKDALDFLLGLLRIPLGLVAHLLTGEQIIPGSFASMYSSVQNLNQSYLVLSDRDILLKPRLPTVSLPLLEPDSPALAPPSPKIYYRCLGNYYPCSSTNLLFLTDIGGMSCPDCQQPMRTEMKFLEKAKAADSDKSGYVKGPITYLVMDDLSIMPMSTISALSLIKKFQLDLSKLCEMTVEFGHKESLELLKASLESTTVLTDVFISKPRVDIDCLQTT